MHEYWHFVAIQPVNTCQYPREMRVVQPIERVFVHVPVIHPRHARSEKDDKHLNKACEHSCKQSNAKENSTKLPLNLLPRLTPNECVDYSLLNSDTRLQNSKFVYRDVNVKYDDSSFGLAISLAIHELCYANLSTFLFIFQTLRDIDILIFRVCLRYTYSLFERLIFLI